MRGEDDQNHFLTVVRNLAALVKLFVGQVNRMEIHHVACQPKKKASNKYGQEEVVPGYVPGYGLLFLGQSNS
jgi:hypothetical protein